MNFSYQDASNSELVNYCVAFLLKAMPEHLEWSKRFPLTEEGQRKLLRGLMNLADPGIANHDFFLAQDELLSRERESKDLIDVFSLPVTNLPGVALYQGDITILKADCIVNAANSSLLGCFVPGHNCIDNCIHSAAGLELREACNALIEQQGHEELSGLAKLTKGYNLPSHYIIHTVAPIVSIRPTKRDEETLKNCYIHSFALAKEHHFKSLVFPCLGTGAFSYPKSEAAHLAINTVESLLNSEGPNPVIIFCTFLDEDYELYSSLLS